MNRAGVIHNVSPESSRRDQPLIVVATRQFDHGHEELKPDTLDALLDQAKRSRLAIAGPEPDFGFAVPAGRSRPGRW
jgi:hypothetical protein